MVVVEGATVTSFVTEATTMLVIGLILSMFGIGFFCWLIFTLTVYALPFVVGLTAGMAAFHGGAGVIGALARRRPRWRAHPCQSARSHSPSSAPCSYAPLSRLLFAVPAAIAGYHAVLGLSQIGVPSLALARGVRLDRRDLHRRHGLGAHDAVCPHRSCGQGAWRWSGSVDVAGARVQGRVSSAPRRRSVADRR